MDKLPMRQSVRVLVLVLAITSPTVGEESVSRTESSGIPKVLRIFHKTSQWQLKIRDDGSATLGVGSSFADTGYVMPGSFNMQDVYERLLKEGVTTDKKTELSYDVAFSKSNYSQRGYIADMDLWRDLVKTASENLFNANAKRIKALLSSHSPDGVTPRTTAETAIVPSNNVSAIDVKRRRQEREEKQKEIIASLGQGRSAGSEEEIRDAMAFLKEGPSTKEDDLALLALHGIQRNLRGMKKEEWTPSVVSNYYECVSHLKNVRLDVDTKKGWNRYPELMESLKEFNGGDKALSLLIRSQLLMELQQYVDRTKRSQGDDAQEIEAFIKKEAKAISEEWPESELRKIIKKLAEDE
ncbi:hypothetical protein ACFLQR_00080 [Verrucomicrobiota bacterium]